MFFKKSFIALIVTGLLLTACGAQGRPAGEEVRVTLTEFGIQSSIAEFNTGLPYRFVVTNEGVVNHEFMIMPPMTHGQMGMTMNMDELDQMALAMIEADDLPGGATTSFDFTFSERAGKGILEFACYTPGHYEAGMKLPITVK